MPFAGSEAKLTAAADAAAAAHSLCVCTTTAQAKEEEEEDFCLELANLLTGWMDGETAREGKQASGQARASSTQTTTTIIIRSRQRSTALISFSFSSSSSTQTRQAQQWPAFQKPESRLVLSERKGARCPHYSSKSAS